MFNKDFKDPNVEVEALIETLTMQQIMRLMQEKTWDNQLSSSNNKNQLRKFNHWISVYLGVKVLSFI